MGISPAFGEISKGLVERVGSLLLAFHAFHSPGISTALSCCVFVFAPTAASFALALAFRLLILLGVLHPVARDVQFDDHAVMHQFKDRQHVIMASLGQLRSLLVHPQEGDCHRLP